MEFLGQVLIIVGVIIAVIGGIRLIIAAFRTNILWGLGCLIFMYPIMLLYTLLNWSAAKGPFLNNLAGIVLIIVGVSMAAPERWLERAYSERDSFLTLVKKDPIFDPLRDDPRFHDLRRRMNLKP